MTKQEKTSKKKSENKVIRNEKGQIISGTPNPNGRPKGSGISITTEIKRKLEEKPEGQDKATYLQLLIKRILKKAVVEGDNHTIKQIWSYIDGMPKQEIKGEFTHNINDLLNEIDSGKQKETGEQGVEDESSLQD